MYFLCLVDEALRNPAPDQDLPLDQEVLRIYAATQEAFLQFVWQIVDAQVQYSGGLSNAKIFAAVTDVPPGELCPILVSEELADGDDGQRQAAAPLQHVSGDLPEVARAPVAGNILEHHAAKECPPLVRRQRLQRHGPLRRRGHGDSALARGDHHPAPSDAVAVGHGALQAVPQRLVPHVVEHDQVPLVGETLPQRRHERPVVRVAAAVTDVGGASPPPPTSTSTTTDGVQVQLPEDLHQEVLHREALRDGDPRVAVEVVTRRRRRRRRHLLVDAGDEGRLADAAHPAHGEQRPPAWLRRVLSQQPSHKHFTVIGEADDLLLVHGARVLRHPPASGDGIIFAAKLAAANNIIHHVDALPLVIRRLQQLAKLLPHLA
uniref:Uncharacterized protein n=1 Tax=Oryza glumipatula TaxID=40148 RepID=A0A0E0ARU9_9ORYZ